MATFEQLQKANESIRTVNIKGKEYAEVNQRIKAFRMVYPEGFIKTENCPLSRFLLMTVLLFLKLTQRKILLIFPISIIFFPVS